MSVVKQEWWMYFIQWACSNLLVFCSLSLSLLNRSGSCIDNLYSYFCWILVATVDYVSHLGSGGSIVIFMLEKPQWEVPWVVIITLTFALCVLSCLVSQSELILSAQHRALQTDELRYPNTSSGILVQTVFSTEKLEGPWQVCSWIELPGILLLQLIQHALHWEPVAFCCYDPNQQLSTR